MAPFMPVARYVCRPTMASSRHCCATLRNAADARPFGGRDGIKVFLADARDARAAEQLDGANILASLGLRCASPHCAAFAPSARRSWGCRSSHAHYAAPKRVQTFDWCLVTRKLDKLPSREKADVGGPLALAGAPSSGKTHAAAPSVYRKVVTVGRCHGTSCHRGV